MRWPETNSARSHQCEPMSANAREAPPRSSSTRQLSSSGRSSQSCRYVPWISRTGPVAPAAHALARLAHRRVVAVDERARRRARRCRGARRSSRRAPGDVDRERLLADDVLAGGQRRLGERAWRRFGVQMCTTSIASDVASASGDSTSASPEPNARSAAAAALGALERRGGDADEASARASRAERACTAPMKPVPAMPTRSSPSSAFIADSSSVPRRSSSISGVSDASCRPKEPRR